AGSYDVRYSSVASASPASSEANYNAASQLSPIPSPSVRGTTELMTATGLLEGVTYYVVLKARERDKLPGPLSLGVTVQTNGPFGCRVVKNVCKTGCDFSVIQTAVNAIPNPLIGHSCVILRDAATYAEQVTVQNFVNNGSSITIARAPEVA